jgi:hypothetical protein
MRKSSTASRASLAVTRSCTVFGQVHRRADDAGELLGVGAVGLERAARELPELAGGVGGEQVGAAVDRVHRLARPRVAEVASRDLILGGVDASERLGQALRRQGRARRGHRPLYITARR